MKNFFSFFQRNLEYIVWLQVLAATLGSLYYSEIRHFTPCVLCWYQRIFMYPLVILLAVGIIRKDKNLAYYGLSLSIPGTLVALYHVLLQKGILPEAVAPCELGASCLTKFVGYFGFITIPVMSLFAFCVITLLLFMILRRNKNDQRS